MDALRTPEERFANLPEFAFAAHEIDIPAGDGELLRMAYLDEGPREGRIVLLLHGEPTYSYLYRKMIPPIVAAGYRAIAPDLIGFGRSDKPVRRSDYTFANHVAWLTSFVFDLGLRDAVLFGQDWGGLIGLRMLAERSERFAGAVAANTFLPTGDEPPSEAFERWRAASQAVPEFTAGYFVARTCTPRLGPEIAAAYDAPFPYEEYAVGARQFPMLVPTRPDDPASAANRAAWAELERFEKPFLCAFSDGDPITRGSGAVLARKIPGARSFEHPTIAGASHFLQEDKPEELVAAMLAFFTAAGLSPT
jgi:haloalkane dehalogenase